MLADAAMLSSDDDPDTMSVNDDSDIEFSGMFGAVNGRVRIQANGLSAPPWCG